MLDNKDYKHTRRICNNFCFSTVTLVTRTCLNGTLYVQCLSCSFANRQSSVTLIYSWPRWIWKTWTRSHFRNNHFTLHIWHWNAKQLTQHLYNWLLAGHVYVKNRRVKGTTAADKNTIFITRLSICIPFSLPALISFWHVPTTAEQAPR